MRTKYLLLAVVAFFLVVVVHNIIAPPQDAWLDPHYPDDWKNSHRNFFGR